MPSSLLSCAAPRSEWIVPPVNAASGGSEPGEEAQVNKVRHFASERCPVTRLTKLQVCALGSKRPAGHLRAGAAAARLSRRLRLRRVVPGRAGAPSAPTADGARRHAA